MVLLGGGKITRVEITHHTSPNYGCSNANRIIVRWWEEKPPNETYYYNFKVVENEAQLTKLLIELSKLITYK